MLPLFDSYPALQQALPFVSLGRYPTPVLRADALDPDRRCAGLTVKHDGLSGTPYGGNKVRKLEFLFGDALARGKRAVLTFGGAGSNHALATAIYAQRLGLQAYSFLLRQPNSRSLRYNLLRSLASGAHLRHFDSVPALAGGALLQEARLLFGAHQLPYWIPPGGSSALGVLGYVNAAFELQRQVQAGGLAMPDVIYIASGTMGSAVGLALGLAMLGLPARVCAVAVTDRDFSSLDKAWKLYAQASRLLRRAGLDRSPAALQAERFTLRVDFFGGEYGRYTQAGMTAVKRFREATGMRIEGCYTGKCLAALTADLQTGRLDGQRVLFWNTYDAGGHDHPVDAVDYRLLPAPFHRYFETDIQPLDRD
ncbi:MAG: pyridoxal-phosphate dependent enzyme [Halieaceae bacterium]|nr:pyridoxal-phosphate dependent enzyme [Halieaceae bacterium]